MYGYVDGKAINNQNTGEINCPTGFTSKQVLGTRGGDYPLYYCYK